MISFVLLFSAAAIDLSNKVGKVTWPVTTWVLSPVESTSWHELQTVTLTLSFSSTVDMPPGIAEISFPSGFAVGKLTKNLSSGVVALEDYSVSFDNFVLPAAGIYGPIVIKLRLSAEGTIVAINQFFASIFIEGPKPVPTAGTLTAAFYDVTKQYVRDSSSIYFDFMITKDLWKFDVFYLYIDSKFTISSPICKSQKVIGEYNNLNSSSSTSLNTLPCVYEENFKRVKIYGLGVDIYIDKLSTYKNITGRLMLSGFTNPNADYESSQYSWELYIGRYGVNTFFAAYKGSGPTTSSGKISVTSWKPSKSVYSSKEIPIGMTLYMDLTFSTSHDIPKTGSIKFKFSGGVDIKAKSWRFTTSGKQSESLGDSEYYFFTPYIGGTCTFNTATELICKDFANTVSAGTLTLTTYTYFLSTSPSIMTITTYVDNLQATIIDEVLANPASIVYASSEEMDVTDKFNVFFTDALDNSADDKYLADTGDEANYMIIQLKIPEDLVNTPVTVRLPMSTSTRLLNIQTVSSATGSFASTSTETTLSALTFSSLASVSLSGDTVTFSLTATKDYYITVYIQLASSTFKFPYTGSNLLTRYEAYIELKPTSIKYKYAKGLTFIPDNPTLSFTISCTDASVPGIPATISFTSAFDFTLSSGFDSSVKSNSKLYLDITFTGTLDSALDSGLSQGEDFPYFSSETGKLKLNSPGLIWSDFTSVASATAFALTFPFGKMTNLYFYTASVLLYYINPDRTDVKYEILKSTSAQFQSTASTGSWTTQSISGTTSFKTTESLGSLSITLNEASASSSGRLGFLLPQGFTISSGLISRVSTPMTTFSFTSSNIYFKTPGIFTTLDATNSISGDTVFTLTGITTSTFFNPSSASVDIKPIHSSGNNALCKGISTTTPKLTLQAGSIAKPTFSPMTGTGAGRGSLSVDVTVKFKNTHAIPKGGKIVLQFASNWQKTVTSILSITAKGKTLDLSTLIVTLDSVVVIKNLTAVDASSDILIAISNCVQPTNTGTSDLKVAHFSSISTYGTSDDTQKIDEWLDSTADSLVLKPSANSTNVTGISVEFFPNSTSTSAFFALEFSSKNLLPVGTDITVSSPIKSWLLQGDVSAYLTFSLKFSKASVSAENLQITLAEVCEAGKVMTLIVDNALKFDKNGTTEEKVKISIFYYGVKIDGYENDGFEVKVGAKMLDMIVNLTIDPGTAFEYSNYTFNISTSLTAGSSLSFVFPFDYDYFLGRISRTYVVSSPEIYFIPCSSSFATLECQVQHRTVTTKIPREISSGTITLIGIQNPNITDSNLYIKVYSNSSAGVFSGYEYVKILGISQPSYKNIQIRKLDKTNDYLQKTSDYTFEFYLGVDQTYPLDSLVLAFPDAFELDRDMDSTISCTLHIINTTGSLSLKTEVKSTQKCYNIKKNQVQLVLLDTVSWSNITLAYLTLKEVLNPEFAKEMTTPLDSNAYEIFDQWTNQFTIYILNNTNYVARSYANMNAAYMGFYKNDYTFEVNDYNPLNYEGTIVLIPGTQTKDLYITTTPSLKSKTIKFTPASVKNAPKLEFDSSKSFKIYTGQNSLPFRVSASINEEQGLNFITWEINEGTQYAAPVKTRVEIFKGVVKVNIGKISDIRTGSTSLPVSVSVDYSPHTELIVGIKTSEANLTVHPTTLTFSRGMNQLFYEIEVPENFTSSTGNSILITYELSGTDADAYSIESSTFKTASNDDQVPVIKTVQVANIGKTSMKITVLTDVVSVICWQLTEVSNELKSLAEIKELTASLVGNNSQPSFEEQAQSYEEFLQSKYDSESSWESIQRNYYKEFLTRSFYGCAFNGLTTVEIFNVDWLWAETTYQIRIYAGYEESNYTVLQSTQNFASAVNMTIAIRQNIDKSLIPNVTINLSKDIGLSTAQFEQYAFESTNFTATLYYYIYPDRHSPYVLKDIATLSSYPYLKENLRANGIIGTFTVTNVEIERKAKVPAIISSVDVHAYSKTSITLAVGGESDGEVSCVAVTEQNVTTFPVKQLLGLDDNNTAIGYGRGFSKFNSSVNVIVSGLRGNTEYNISCFGFDRYVIWPNFVNVLIIDSSTKSDDSSTTTVVSAAEYFAIVLAYFLV